MPGSVQGGCRSAPSRSPHPIRTPACARFFYLMSVRMNENVCQAATQSYFDSVLGQLPKENEWICRTTLAFSEDVQAMV